jgi:glutathione S-transferase
VAKTKTVTRYQINRTILIVILDSVPSKKYSQGNKIMTSNRLVRFFHLPNSRSSGVLNLLQELNAEYKMQVLNIKINEQRSAEYLAINPMGKVPAIKHGDEVITEQVAIFLYLADLYPEANLAPKIGDPLRGSYLRWMVYYGTCFEPAIVDRSSKREPLPPLVSPYSDFDTMLNILTEQLSQGDYFLGDKFTALDVLWGRAFTYVTMLELVPLLPVIKTYIDRVNARPAAIWVKEKDAELVAAQG